MDYYKFHCSNCDHKEEHCRGGLLFGEDQYEIFHCKKCGKVESLSLPGGSESHSQSPICCGDIMTVWDEKCPNCSQRMDKTIEYTDVI